MGCFVTRAQNPSTCTVRTCARDAHKMRTHGRAAPRYFMSDVWLNFRTGYVDEQFKVLITSLVMLEGREGNPL